MLTIIVDENDFLVVSKPGGVPFHSTEGMPGIAAQLSEKVGYRLYPVHRLDTVTSGLLIFAKSKGSARMFGQMFSKHLVQKYYLAVAKGKPKKKQGQVAGDMAKSRRGQYKLQRSFRNPAVTQFFSHTIRPGRRLYLLKPRTGKTHQLRVAMASLGTPILGDTLYGGQESDRTWLHAWHLEFQYEGHEYVITENPVNDGWQVDTGMQTVLEGWSPPSALNWPKRAK